MTDTINESINKEGEGVEPRDAAGAARGLAHRRQSPRCVVCVTLCVVCAREGADAEGCGSPENRQKHEGSYAAVRCVRGVSPLC